MRWLRPTVGPDAADEATEDVARQLEAIALDAPPAHRAEEIRAVVLRQVEDARPAVGLAHLAFVAGALLLALAIGVGAPAVGSFIETMIDRGAGPEEQVPGPDAMDDTIDRLIVPMPPDPALPSDELRAAPSAAPSDAAAGPGQPAQPAQSPWGGDGTSDPPASPVPTPVSPALSGRPPSGPPVPLPAPPASGPPAETPLP